MEQVRLLRGLKQEEAGSFIGLTKHGIYRIEKGKRDMYVTEMARYSVHMCFRIEPLLALHPDGQWDITACLMPYPAPVEQE